MSLYKYQKPHMDGFIFSPQRNPDINQYNIYKSLYQSIQWNQNQNNNSNSLGISSSNNKGTYNAVTNEHFPTNKSMSHSRNNVQERTGWLGNTNGNYLTRTLGKPAPGDRNIIQSNSYNIINLIPNSTSNSRNERVSLNCFNKMRRDHVSEFLSKEPDPERENSYNMFNVNGQLSQKRMYKDNNRYHHHNNNNWHNISQREISEKLNKIISEKENSQIKYNMRENVNSNNVGWKYIEGYQGTKPRSNCLKGEHQSLNALEYLETSCSAVQEYSYKEDPNSGNRQYMEDRGQSIDSFNNDRNNALFLLFDGHGGGEVSKYLQENFASVFRSHLPSKNIEWTWTKVFDILDQQIKNTNFFNVGSTGCVVYITSEHNKRILYCANVGDTRCVLIKNNKATRLSYDDRASDVNEYNRIVNVGGVIFAGRVYGQLILSRAFVDWTLKRYGVICVPHIKKIEIEKDDRYIVMATDGIWDVFDDSEMVKIIRKKGGVKGSTKDICDEIMNTALNRGSMDNISCFVIKWN